ncbi:unnamed protein product [Pleuronectes platessa]|uniref:Uncharacterized protein n=1 Tax=Pleuronectes platessa TaxID=8262 RepID=A0A9N7YJR2_PLEPL|nr:unnamed protein product [Pleuronectes platessa]
MIPPHQSFQDVVEKDIDDDIPTDVASLLTQESDERHALQSSCTKKSKEPPTTSPDEQPEVPTTTQGDSAVPGTHKVTSQEPTSSSSLQGDPEEMEALTEEHRSSGGVAGSWLQQDKAHLIPIHLIIPSI